MSVDKEMRFGVVAINKGYVTPEQVIEALNIQVKEDISAGKHRKVGMILLEQGHMTLMQVDEVLKELEEKLVNT
jgi:hypothetical protein